MNAQRSRSQGGVDAGSQAELRRLWHALGGQRRAVKEQPRFAALHALSPIETGTLDVVAEAEGVTMGEVGRALGLAKSTVTSLVDRLEGRGYLCRVPGARDRRAFGLVLTPRGRTAYRAHVRFEDEVGRRMLAGLESDAERAGFLAALRKMVAGLERAGRHA